MSNSPQTYDSLDGRMIHREGRSGQYVRLSDYEALEKMLDSRVSATPEEIGRVLKCPITGVVTPQKPADMQSIDIGEAWINESLKQQAKDAGMVQLNNLPE